MKPKKKILHLIQSLSNGGCENMLLRTLPLLQDEFEHHIIALKELGELASRFKKKGISVVTIHQSSFFDISSYRRLLTETRHFNPDIISTYLFHADMIGRLFIRPFLLFQMKRDNSLAVIPFLRTTYNCRRYLIARILEKLTKNFVPRYLANSEAVKNFYIKNIGVSGEKITVIPNCINLAIFEKADGSKIIKEFKFPQNRFIIICVANFSKSKGHKYLLEAFEELNTYSQAGKSKKKLRKELFLLLVGDGTERKNIEKQIKNYQSRNHIIFLGRRTDVPDILKASDCFVLPTLFEGMSNAILEAMAASLPIITTDIPENRILIKNNVNGLLVPIQKSSVIAKAMERIKENDALRKRLSLEAPKTIKSTFSLEKSAKTLKKFLVDALP